MTRQDRALRRAMQLLNESTRKMALMRRRLVEFRLQKPDGTPVTPSDLYYAVNELAAGYSGQVGEALSQAARILYKAHIAYKNPMERGGGDNPGAPHPSDARWP
jgi:hypothetical protein